MVGFPPISQPISWSIFRRKNPMGLLGFPPHFGETPHAIWMSSIWSFGLQHRPFHTSHTKPDHTSRDTHSPRTTFEIGSLFFLGGKYVFFHWLKLRRISSTAAEKIYCMHAYIYILYIYIVYTCIYPEIAKWYKIRLYKTHLIHMITSDMFFFLQWRTPKNMYEFLASLPLGLNKFQPTFQCSAHHQAVSFLGGVGQLLNRTMVNDAMSGDATLPGAVSSESLGDHWGDRDEVHTLCDLNLMVTYCWWLKSCTTWDI